MVDDTGLTSSNELGTQRLRWDQVVCFTYYGSLVENHVAAELADGHKVLLQYQLFPQNTILALERLRTTRPPDPPPAPDPAESAEHPKQRSRGRKQVAFVALCVVIFLLLPAFGIWTLTSSDDSYTDLL
ncbi:MAG: PH domain-containing protein, partial [Janthinobacterium lividum]